jgi:hypothetical protein
MQVVWDPSQRATFVREHPSTTAEVCALCADLRVLGRSEFKQLLRWRLKVRGSLLKAEAEAAPKHSGAEAEMEAEGSEKEKDPEAELLAEMDHLREKAAHEFKVGRKKARELKRKARLRLAASAATAGIGEEVQAEEDALFDLSAVRGRSMLQAIGAHLFLCFLWVKSVMYRFTGLLESWAQGRAREGEGATCRERGYGVDTYIHTYSRSRKAQHHRMARARCIITGVCSYQCLHCGHGDVSIEIYFYFHAAGDAPALDEQQVEDIVDAPNSDDELVNATARGSESGDDEEALEYEAMVEEYLDNAYQSYLQRQLARGANQKEKVKRHRLADTGAPVRTYPSS